MMKHSCPVCHYDSLQAPPYDASGIASFEICPCCGFQFGNDDFPSKEEAFAAWREDWIRAGCPWFSSSRIPPDDWDAFGQISDFSNPS